MALFNKRTAKNIALNPREDADVLAIQARLAELSDIIAQAQSHLAEHDARIAEAATHLDRAELDVLAGRGTEAVLAEKQAAHLARRREKAIDLIAVQDAQAEQAKLEARLPEALRRARLAAGGELRRQFLAQAQDMRAALLTVQEASERLVALRLQAEQAFPGDDALGVDGRQAVEAPRAAGLRAIGHERFDYGRRMRIYENPGGTSVGWLAEVDEAIAAVQRLQAELDG